MPSVSFPGDSHLLNRESIGNSSMQVNGNCPNFGQLDVQIRYGIFRKLRKQQSFQLPVLFESGTTKTSVLKILPTFMKLFDDLLKNLRRNFTC